MAFAEGTRCRSCKAPVEFIVNAVTGKAMMFDPEPPTGPTSPNAARWVQFPDRRTGTPRARRLAKDEHLEPDDELIRPHYATCDALTRNNHDR